MTDNQGVTPSGSGYSAEPEPSCTVSAVPVSIPNADPTFENLCYLADVLAASADNAAERKSTSRYELDRQRSICDKAIRALQGQSVSGHRRSAATVIDRLYRARTYLASAIEARSAKTPKSGLVRKDESAVPKGDAQP